MDTVISFEHYISGDSEHRRLFAELNREWLVEYALLEAPDEEVLADPEAHILVRDGNIIFAKVDGKAVGTGVLFHHEDGLYELGKMAVTREMRGKGIGRLIAEKLILLARSKGARALYLGSNRKLESALALYRSLGFKETSLNHHIHYGTCEINMKLELTQ